jgi:hypothetical protein
MTSGKRINVQELDHGIDSQFLRMGSLAIRESLEAMQGGVAVRDGVCSDGLSQGAKQRETAPATMNQGEHDRREREVRIM